MTREDLVIMKYLLPKLEARRLEIEAKLRKENPCWPFAYNQQFIDDVKKWHEDSLLEHGNQ